MRCKGAPTETIPAAAGGWISAETPPDHPCECVVEFDLGEGVKDIILCRWAGKWFWRGSEQPVEDSMTALRWCEVPCATPARPVPAVLDTAADASAWIRVEDALPEPGVNVVTLDSDGDVDIDRIDADTGKYFYGGEGRSCHVTHWTALPEKPEEEQ